MANSEKLNSKNIGNLIRSKRKELGMTQTQVAEIVGLTMQHYSRLERGEYIPSLQTFINIAENLKLDINIFDVSQKNKISTTMYEILSLLKRLSTTKQKAVLSFLKTMA